MASGPGPLFSPCGVAGHGTTDVSLLASGDRCPRFFASRGRCRRVRRLAGSPCRRVRGRCSRRVRRRSRRDGPASVRVLPSGGLRPNATGPGTVPPGAPSAWPRRMSSDLGPPSRRVRSAVAGEGRVGT